MKKKIIIPAAVAFLSFAAMFFPMAEEREFGEYDHLTGAIPYIFRRAASGYYESEPIWKIFALFLILSAILLIIWGIVTIRKQGDVNKIGIAASTVNLITEGLVFIAVTESRDPFYLGIAAVCVISVFTLVMSFIQMKAKKGDAG